MKPRPALRKLSERLGILPGYVDATGVRRTTLDRTRVAIAAAMGFDGSTEAAARRSLEALAEQRVDMPARPVEKLGRCHRVEDVLGRRRAVGLWTHLYALRRSQDWGIGDVRDLTALARFAGRCGVAFVGINPLHAVANRGLDISPYSPLSRLFFNAAYIDVERVPEAATAGRALSRPDGFRRDPEGVPRVVYDAVIARKLDVLRGLYREFLCRHEREDSARAQAYRRFRRERGASLVDFGTFMAIGEKRTAAMGRWTGFARWPKELRDPRSDAVAWFRAEHRNEIGFHCWLQFELDRQLGLAGKAAVGAGVSLGLYFDLAVGSARDGFDVWANPDLFVRGVSMGCPPDAHSDRGQDWSFPPLHPLVLRRTRCGFWTELLRANLRHAGMLRIDHVMWLFRQFWIPRGSDPIEGAYVRYPARDLLNILARESRAHGTVIVGEDLGTVAPKVPKTMRRYGILSTRVLYFERDRRGGFKPANRYERNALVTATTHDHATLAGHYCGWDLVIRRRIGLLPTKKRFQLAFRERDAELAELARRIGMPAGEDVPCGDWQRAVHAFLSRTPAPLLAVSLDDLEGEIDPVNVPGTTQARFPNWTRRMQRTLEQIGRDERLRRTLSGIVRARIKRRMP